MDYDNKIGEIEGKIPNITCLATITTLNAVENNMPSVSNLAKKNRLRCKSIKYGRPYQTLSDITRPQRKFCLSLHYNGSNNFLFVHL